MPDSVWVRARQLSLSHTVRIGACTLDILHVAAALSLGVSSFLTFDRTQARLARAEGLLTPIEIPWTKPALSRVAFLLLWGSLLSGLALLSRSAL
jgi:hypothetical protein